MTGPAKLLLVPDQLPWRPLVNVPQPAEQPGGLKEVSGCEGGRNWHDVGRCSRRVDIPRNGDVASACRGKIGRYVRGVTTTFTPPVSSVTTIVASVGPGSGPQPNHSRSGRSSGRPPGSRRGDYAGDRRASQSC